MNSQILLQEENERLRKAVDELSVLNDLAKMIGGSRNSNEIIEIITRRSMNAVGAEQCVITLVKINNDDTMKTLIRTSDESGEYEKYHLNQNILGWMSIHKKTLIVNEPLTDERFKGIEWSSTTRNMISVPLMIKSELLGVLTAYNKKGNLLFSTDDQRLLSIIATQSAQVIENARLYEQEKMLAIMREQVVLAAKIQDELLPQKAPEIPGYEVVGKSIPAQVVGGDYFDFITIDDCKTAIVLGDVTGKGLPASLLMANVQATLRGQAMFFISPKECMNHSNFLLHRSTSDEKFVTLFYAVLDSQQHSLSYCNAGHDHPILISETAGDQQLATGGVPLGIMQQGMYEEESILLHPGDILIAYSDGVTEAMNSAHEQLGLDTLLQLLKNHRKDTALNILETIYTTVQNHIGSTEQSDDITVVVVKRI